MSFVCRTCLCQVSDSYFLGINDSLAVKNQLSQCIPELSLSLVNNPIMCIPCVTALDLVSDFKNQCLQTEKRILNHLDLVNTDSVNLIEILYITENASTTTAIKRELNIISDEGLQDDCLNNEPFIEDHIEINKHDVDDSDPLDNTEDVSPKSESEDGCYFIEQSHLLAQNEAECVLDYPGCEEYCSSNKQTKGSGANHQTLDGKPKFNCDLCEYSTNLKPSLKRHMITHTVEKPFKCNQCNYSSAYNSHLKIHMANHSGNLPYKCKICDYTTSWRSALNRHMFSHTGEKPYKCNQCDYMVCEKSSFKVHMMKHSSGAPFHCNVCEYTTINKDYIWKHMIKHTEEAHEADAPPNQQSDSNAQIQKSKLTKQDKEKPIKCRFCEYATTIKSRLKMHMMVHTGERPFKCNLCNYSSGNKYNLKMHAMKHKEEMPFKCNQCNYSTVNKSCLKIHTIRKHSEEKPYVCQVCGYRTAVKFQMSRHMLNSGHLKMSGVIRL